MARDTAAFEPVRTPVRVNLAEAVEAPDAQDLLYSYLRITTPELRRAAIAAVRAIADASRTQAADADQSRAA